MDKVRNVHIRVESWITVFNTTDAKLISDMLYNKARKFSVNFKCLYVKSFG